MTDQNALAARGEDERRRRRRRRRKGEKRGKMVCVSVSDGLSAVGVMSITLTNVAWI